MFPLDGRSASLLIGRWQELRQSRFVCTSLLSREKRLTARRAVDEVAERAVSDVVGVVGGDSGEESGIEGRNGKYDGCWYYLLHVIVVR